MARGFQRLRGRAAEQVGEINISPLIDIVFILLIFFIVTTIFAEETGVEVEKPRAAAQQDLDRESVLIGITAEGAVFHAGREIGVGGVRAVVSRMLRTAQVPVVIQADRRTDTEQTIAVLDEAKLAGAERVFVSTLGAD